MHLFEPNSNKKTFDRCPNIRLDRFQNLISKFGGILLHDIQSIIIKRKYKGLSFARIFYLELIQLSVSILADLIRSSNVFFIFHLPRGAFSSSKLAPNISLSSSFVGFVLFDNRQLPVIDGKSLRKSNICWSIHKVVICD